uniref:Uncharacterized protein n=1 Tax=Sphaerodactylus townsendi TaxID=933632 RepID=A0ACB8EC83_9SAUR
MMFCCHPFPDLLSAFCWVPGFSLFVTVGTLFWPACGYCEYYFNGTKQRYESNRCAAASKRLAKGWRNLEYTELLYAILEPWGIIFEQLSIHWQQLSKAKFFLFLRSF